MNEERKIRWAIVGGGNGGQATAGHLAIMGFPVRLYDIFPQTVQEINEIGGIYVNGEVNGFGKLEFPSTDIKEVIEDADIIAVVTPSLAHPDVAKKCAKYLRDGQIVYLHPGAAFGALEFRKVLDDNQCTADVTIAEAESLIYATRIEKPGYATIFGIKKTLMVAALPATENERVVNMLKLAYPQIYAGANVLHTSLQNPNNMVHPGPSLLNTSLIESKHEWKYYHEGITPTIGAYVEKMDEERVNLGKAFGLNLLSILDVYKKLYGVEAATLSETVQKNQAYAGIKGQKSMNTRYLLEDIPNGLVPLISLAKLVGVGVGRMETMVRLGEYVLNKNFYETGRTLGNLGLGAMSKEELLEYVQTGRKPNENKVGA